MEAKTKTVYINVGLVIGSKHAHYKKQGLKLFYEIKKALSEENNVMLSFSLIDSIITKDFLFTAIGQLFAYFSSDIISGRITVKEISERNYDTLRRVIHASDIYYNENKSYNNEAIYR